MSDLSDNTDFIPQTGDRIDIVLYTDPLCCWSWAFEPHWRRFTERYAGYIHWNVCMTGMIPNWQTFNDPFNSVSKPIQMGALWMHIRETTGARINDTIWVDDPPSSSYPACLAVKCAGLQSPQAEQFYLQAAREAVMVKGRNIANVEVLHELAFELSREDGLVLDYERFKRDFNGPECRNALKSDLDKVRYHRIGRFPTITMAHRGRGLMITGYRPFEALEEVFFQICPAASKAEAPSTPQV